MGNIISLITRAPPTPEDTAHVRQPLNEADHTNVQHLGLESEIFFGTTINLTNFNPDIRILAANDEWVFATALLDTQYHVGNWISHRLVERLGKQSLIGTEFIPPEIFDASGRPVRACGVIDLEYKWHPRGTRNHVDQFYVFPQSGHLDVVFGRDYIVSERLLQVNELAFLTLVEHKKSKKGEKAAIDQAKERQQKEKEALEERKRQQQQQKGSKGSGSN